MSFQSDLLAAQVIERELGSILEQKGWKVEYNESTIYEELCWYDLQITDTKTNLFYWLEVKHDKMVEVTGNVAVEWKCMNHSRSGTVVYKLKDKFYYCKRDTLLEQFVDGTPWRRTNTKDSGNAIILIPIDEFLKLVKELE